MESGEMDIATYFALPLTEDYHPVGRVTDWLTVGRLALHSGKLSIGDAVIFPDEQFAISLEKGEYIVQVVIVDHGTVRSLTRLRVALPESIVALQLIGTITVEFAVVGVCDGPEFLAALQRASSDGRDYDRYHDLYLSQLANEHRAWGIVAIGDEEEVKLLSVISGLGDGTYPIYQLESDHRAVGVEVVFISNNDDSSSKNLP